MNPGLARLHPYPFQQLQALKDAAGTPPAALAHISMAIGEPRHAPPAFVLEAHAAALADGATAYPATAGIASLREAAAAWLSRRYGLARRAVDPDSMVLPVNGTREALFAFAQALVDPCAGEAVLMPNPFYQIYEGAALLAGAEPVYLPCTAATGWLPDLDAVPAGTWARCRVFYVCTPGNPTGAVMDADYLARVLELADRHDFVIAADECYAEIHLDENVPPPGVLEVCARLGRDGFERVVAFHSLSKRSNVPGLRSGFVAGDRAVIADFLRYRTYHGCAMPTATQHASTLAWADDEHVAVNRALYREKFDRVLPVLEPWLDVFRPAAGFYLWPRVGDDDEAAAASLWRECHLSVLPGRYLARPGDDGVNPGAGRLRLSLVASVDDCVVAAERIAAWCERHGIRTASS